MAQTTHDGYKLQSQQVHDGRDLREPSHPDTLVLVSTTVSLSSRVGGALAAVAEIRAVYKWNLKY